MFGAGGKALTASEQKVAAGYLTDIYTNPKAAATRLPAIRRILENAAARRTGGGRTFAPPVEDVITDENWGR